MRFKLLVSISLISIFIFVSAEYLTEEDIDRIIEDLDREDAINSEEEALNAQLVEPEPEFPDPVEDFPSSRNFERKIIRVEIHPHDPPGHMGSPLVIDNPTEKQQALIQRGYDRNEYNEYVSDQISIQRQLPDVRNDRCKDPGFHLKKLMATSVIICFHNEGWSVLLRTIHSILDRTPEHLLTEIVLVDDFSDHDHLKSKLETYVKTLFKVKLIRAQQREGLIRGRMLGAAYAEGPILTFLDSHVEVTEGWAEPLLDRITRNWTTVACPIIDIINEDTFEYGMTAKPIDIVGGFRWEMIVELKLARVEVVREIRSLADPIQSPTMPGGFFSIHKGFWEHLGQYDPEFEIWGGENLELSFKAWMCGGSVEIVPCSHIGHVFRSKSPFSFPDPDDMHRNFARLAAVWLDDYAQYFFQKLGIPQSEFDFGDISSRLALKNELQCKPFSWYVENVYPDLFNPSKSIAEGEVRSEAFGGTGCLDTIGRHQFIDLPVGIFRCHGQSGNQLWGYTMSGEVRRDNYCLDYAEDKRPEIVMHFCHNSGGNQLWNYDDNTGFIIHVTSGKCLTRLRATISMEPCDDTITQRWKFSQYNNHNDPEKNQDAMDYKMTLLQRQTEL